MTVASTANWPRHRACRPSTRKILHTIRPIRRAAQTIHTSDPNLFHSLVPHVYDSAPMRPVSVAIQEGVGMFLGDSAGRGSSVFGRFW